MVGPFCRKGLRSVGPFCRKGLSPQGEPVRRGLEDVRLIQVDLIRSGRGEPRSPAGQAGPTSTAAGQAGVGTLKEPIHRQYTTLFAPNEPSAAVVGLLLMRVSVPGAVGFKS